VKEVELILNTVSVLHISLTENRYLNIIPVVVINEHPVHTE